MSRRLGYSDFDEILGELENNYRIYAPKSFHGIGAYSDTDVIRYGEIKSVSEIVTRQKTHYSVKEIFFPITQTLFYYFDDETRAPKLDDKGIIIFLRPCDINAVNSLDKVFLENGNIKDVYYEGLRSKIKVFMLECREGFDNCFCASMNANKTGDYDAAFRFGENEVLCEIKNDDFIPLFQNKGVEIEFTPEFVERDYAKVSLPQIEKITTDMFDDSMWSEYSKRCIACGRCNFVCPTCSCWTMQDIQYEGSQSAGERRRVWASCHVDRYSDMAGGHSFRRSSGERMRFKVFHKIYDFKKRFGFNMCTGCGRCDDICPEYISYRNAVNKVTKLTEEVQHDGK